MSYGYICDRCRKQCYVNYGAVEIRARFLNQGRYNGRRWLHACSRCWDDMWREVKDSTKESSR